MSRTAKKGALCMWPDWFHIKLVLRYAVELEKLTCAECSGANHAHVAANAAEFQQMS